MKRDKVVVRVDNLVKRYGKTLALKGISFEVYEGEVFGLLGPNGAGKTTTIKAIGGALKPTKGRVFVFNMDSYRDSLKVKQYIGVVPELPSMYPEFTVRENLYIMARFYGVKKHVFNDRLREISEKLDLKPILDVRYGNLSKGYKRRVDIAAALVHDPQILLLDEPTAGLDVLSANKLRELIAMLSRMGKTIILASHYIDEVMKLSNRVILLYKGSKIYSGRPEDLRRALRLGKRIVIVVDKDIDEPTRSELEETLFREETGGLRSIEGKVIEAYSTDPVHVLDSIKELLISRGYRVVDVDVVPPSWEDVFVKYIEPFTENKCEGCPLARQGVCG